MAHADYFCRVENGAITRVNVSAKDARKGLVNFPSPADDDDYRAAGFWPIIGARPHNGNKHKTVKGPSYQIDSQTRLVNRVYTVEDRPVPVISAAMVIAERTRRFAAGLNHDFGDARGVHRIGTTEDDIKGWDEVTQIALVRKASGATDGINVVTDTGAATVTPDEWLAVMEEVAAFRQPIWQASFVLQASDPIPTDYTDDKHWP